jgi:hypothetical protein
LDRGDENHILGAGTIVRSQEFQADTDLVDYHPTSHNDAFSLVDGDNAASNDKSEASTSTDRTSVAKRNTRRLQEKQFSK